MLGQQTLQMRESDAVAEESALRGDAQDLADVKPHLLNDQPTGPGQLVRHACRL